MKAQEALTEFEAMIEASGKSLQELSAKEAVKLMTDFYLTIRAEDCSVDEDRDMLLFQWGAYDWGEGKYFEYDITRQFMFEVMCKEDGEEWEDEDVWQLSLTLKFQAAGKPKELEGDRWCAGPEDVTAFVEFVDAHEATRHVSDEKPILVELNFESTE